MRMLCICHQSQKRRQSQTTRKNPLNKERERKKLNILRPFLWPLRKSLRHFVCPVYFFGAVCYCWELWLSSFFLGGGGLFLPQKLCVGSVGGRQKRSRGSNRIGQHLHNNQLWQLKDILKKSLRGDIAATLVEDTMVAQESRPGLFVCYSTLLTERTRKCSYSSIKINIPQDFYFLSFSVVITSKELISVLLFIWEQTNRWISPSSTYFIWKGNKRAAVGTGVHWNKEEEVEVVNLCRWMERGEKEVRTRSLIRCQSEERKLGEKNRVDQGVEMYKKRQPNNYLRRRRRKKKGKSTTSTKE